ncbi:NAD(P)-dependent oxidoreductase [Streptomyces sp. NPDC003487]
MEKIAFLGLGRMGAPMARRLLAAGHPLTVFNRTPARAEPLVAEGAVAADSPERAVRDADVVITMLEGPEALAAVADAVVPVLRPGVTWAEMSTVGPDAVRELAGRLGNGVRLVDAPVMGSTDRAAEGTLGILAGGDASAVEHVLARLGRVTRTGPLGSGAALKHALAVKDLALATAVTPLPAARAVAGQLRAAAADPALAGADLSRAVPRIRTAGVRSAEGAR